mmetsp:Transcript_60337/g.186803  ORF Transcript_60337/g.186803 Transcript_60337/m.186803 type:complete len:169 (+) Transcript_60337:122-628(+)
MSASGRVLLVSGVLATAAAFRDMTGHSQMNGGEATGWGCEQETLSKQWGDFVTVASHVPDRVSPEDETNFQNLASPWITMVYGFYSQTGVYNVMSALKQTPSKGLEPTKCGSVMFGPYGAKYTALYQDNTCVQGVFSCVVGKWSMTFFETYAVCPSMPGAMSKEQCAR